MPSAVLKSLAIDDGNNSQTHHQGIPSSAWYMQTAQTRILCYYQTLRWSHYNMATSYHG